MSPSISPEIEKSRRDILDISLRNPLLNFRPSKRRGLEVVDERSHEVFKILVQGERAMYFIPAPKGKEVEESNEDVSPELLELLAEPTKDSQGPAARHTDNKLQTALNLASMNLHLRESVRQARLSIEEQGVNILYLSLGMLKWYESESSSEERRAPLVLIPVQLTQSSLRANFKLSWTKDEIEPNLSLDAKLRQDFHIRLPQMSSEADLVVDSYLDQVERAVEGQGRWSVEHDEIHLNFFSFSKLLIYKDLEPASWPEENQPEDHPLVKQLFGAEGFATEPSYFEGGGEDHGDLGDAGLHPVVDADSSQSMAVLEAMKGRNLVIQGPPGTGKSQTITNLIGEALARGKTILFVAEKMAALEVVKRRLDTIHLGDACLELHSHKTNKRSVLDELRRTLALGRPTSRSSEEDRVLLEENRKRLNDYSQAVNSPVEKSDMTPHDLVGRIEQLGVNGLVVEGQGLSIQGVLSWNSGDFTRRRELVREMQELVRAIGIPRRNLWWVCGRLHFVPRDVATVKEVMEKVVETVSLLERDSAPLQKTLGHEAGFGNLTSEALQRLIRSARMAAAAPALMGADHRHPGWASETERISHIEGAARSYAEIRVKLDPALIPEAWDQDVLAERQALRMYDGKWSRFLSGTFRKAQMRVRGLCREDGPKTVAEQIELVDAILQANRMRKDIEGSMDLVAKLFPGLALGDRAQTYKSFAEALNWLSVLHQEESEGLLDEVIHNLLEEKPNLSGLASAADACERRLKELDRALEAFNAAIEAREDRLGPGEALHERAYGEMAEWLRKAQSRAASIHDVVRFNQLEKRLAEAGIPEVTEAAASREDASQHLTGLFEHACYSDWLDLAFRERSSLAEFDSATHETIVKRFRELDRAQFHHNRALMADRHWQQLPRHQGGGQLGILKREFEKKSRHLPVRRLMEESGRAIQSIKPVFMMSPLSIAKYIPPGSVEFDLVVFDEASQVRPVEALGAIIRGNQAIVVGDSKQLPPTSFFDKMEEDDDDDASQTADLESILGMFCAKGAPERMLRWHYRSRHESLITVSNHEFYDDRLVVFPSPDAGKEDTGLIFRHYPDAPYERKGKNTAEAKQVAKDVMDHARNTPELTLGVAAFSTTQARRIEDEVDILRRQDPSGEEFFSAHPEEPFFVKNLENVQGDERDVILISIGYGKIEGAYLPMNFGPLNRDGGERRLNVLITRAKRRCEVYCNFVAADLDLRRSKARGVAALKTFLEYAETGLIDIAEITGKGPDSPFEEAVAQRLRSRGHDIENQVGSSGFFIDLAVRDPSRPGRYILAIECDGAAYHSSRSARDRDRLRQQVLEGLGWKIHRIWSTDWFRNPDKELDHVEAAIQMAQASEAPEVETVTEVNKPLERGPEPVVEIPKPVARPYKLANLTRKVQVYGEPLHETAPETLALWIGQVVEVESPVHFEEVALRIRQAAGVKRAGNRIMEQMKRGEWLGECQGLYRRDHGHFLWHSNEKPVVVRRRDGNIPPSLRNPQRIASEEIGEALISVVRVSFGIKPEDAAREAIRLFGFKQSGRKILRRFNQVVEFLVAEGTLVKEGEYLRLKAEAD